MLMVKRLMRPKQLSVTAIALGCIYMRPGRTQTGMSPYRPPYIFFYAFTWDRPDNELRPVWLRLGCWTETRNCRTGLSSYRSHINDNKSLTGSRNFKPVCFWVSDIFIWQNMSFCPKTRHQAFRPGFIPVWVHTGLSSSRSHVNTPLATAQVILWCACLRWWPDHGSGVSICLTLFSSLLQISWIRLNPVPLWSTNNQVMRISKVTHSTESTVRYLST